MHYLDPKFQNQAMRGGVALLSHQAIGHPALTGERKEDCTNTCRSGHSSGHLTVNLLTMTVYSVWALIAFLRSSSFSAS